MITPNWRPKWLNQDRGNRPVTVERDRRGHAADVMSPEGSNLRSSCLSGRNDLPQKERHRVRRHSARRAPRDTKRRWRPGDKDLARSRYKRRAHIGHKRRSVLKPATKSAKDVTKKERGMELVSDSDLVTNCGMEDRQATPATKVTMEDRACSSPTLLAVARANKNKGGSVRAWKEA